MSRTTLAQLLIELRKKREQEYETTKNYPTNY